MLQVTAETAGMGTLQTFNCDTSPAACAPPFNCNGKRPATMESAGPFALATADGHSNPSFWCNTNYLQAAVECAAGNLTGFGHLLPDLHRTMSKRFGFDFLDVDAQFCFMLGHCDSLGEAQNGMTLTDGEAMCDRRFGREKWVNGNIRESLLGMGKDLLTLKAGFNPFQRTLRIGNNFVQGMAKVACAMGSYHCHENYCKEVLCKDPVYSQLYAHLGGMDKHL